MDRPSREEGTDTAPGAGTGYPGERGTVKECTGRGDVYWFYDLEDLLKDLMLPMFILA